MNLKRVAPIALGLVVVAGILYLTVFRDRGSDRVDG